jgi:hypothetical protein
MADGDSVQATSRGVLEEADHPVMFVLAMLMVLIAGQALVKWLGTNLDLPGLTAIAGK